LLWEIMDIVTGASLPFDPIEEARRQWVEHGWADVADGMAAVTSIMRAQQLFLGRVDGVLRPYDLTFARYELLMLLVFSRSGALPLSRIGARLQVHATSVTSAVDRLERQGFVRRRPHPTDGRTTLAELTDEGREAAAAATKTLNEHVFASPGLADEQLRALFHVLRDLRQQAGDF
jgi:DNA-binding MarR family transcriptional regulator